MNMNFNIDNIKNAGDVKKAIAEIKTHHIVNRIDAILLNEKGIHMNDELYDEIFNEILITLDGLN